MKIREFKGINNVSDEMKLGAGELTSAVNVDVWSRGNLRRRRGRTLLAAGDMHDLFEAPFGLLARVGADLKLFDKTGTLLRTVYPSIGFTRVWYVLFNDGRVAFSNGLITGVATATDTLPWGVPTPPDCGDAVAGVGTMRMITYVRDSDGLEGPPCYGGEFDSAAGAIVNLPSTPGYSINVYFGAYGRDWLLAGNTTTDWFLHDGSQLGASYTDMGVTAPPAGTSLYSWNSRILIADGKTLWATRPFQPELVDATQDFIQLPSEITTLYGTGAGLFVGTVDELYYFTGTVWRDMKAQTIASGYVARGSMVEVSLNYLHKSVRPTGIQQGALCLIDGAVFLIFGDGQVNGLTNGRYKTAATEVYATTRLHEGVLQYIAVPA